MTKVINNPFRTNAVKWGGETNVNWSKTKADLPQMKAEFDETIPHEIVNYLTRLDRRDQTAVIRQNGGRAFFIPLKRNENDYSAIERVEAFRRLNPEQIQHIAEVMYARTAPEENLGIQSCGLINPGLLENVTPNNFLANGAATLDSVARGVTPFLPLAYGVTGLVLIGYGIYAWLHLPNIDPIWGCKPGAHLVYDSFHQPNHCERGDGPWGSYFATNSDYPIREQAENLMISSFEAGGALIATGIATIKATFEEAGRTLGNLGASNQTYFYFEANKVQGEDEE